MVQIKLWIYHVSWTRSLIVSDVSSLEDKNLVLEKLLKNQDDISGNKYDLSNYNKLWYENAAYDKGEDHMIMFADIISEGIIKQFPQKFK